MNKGLFWSSWVGESLPVPIPAHTCTHDPHGFQKPMPFPNCNICLFGFLNDDVTWLDVVAVQGPIANILYTDILCCSHMTTWSLLAPLQDSPWIPCLFPAFAWLFGRSQAAPHGDESGIHCSALSTLQLLYWTPPRAQSTQYPEHQEPNSQESVDSVAQQPTQIFQNFT